jgi:glucose-6-phosphate 1-dehydrogenase
MNRLFYLSIPPQVYGPLVKHLGEHGLHKPSPGSSSDVRLLVEKPFGYDLISAEELIKETTRDFSEDQIFRIDHYLAKETVQNILTFRRYNPLFWSIWNNQHIQYISVNAAEKIGIEGRANFYENVGALRDLVQSHLLQLLAITTMDLPEDLSDSNAIHRAKEALLNAVKPPHADEISEKVIRAQYDGYRDEVSNQDSVTETFVSLELNIDMPQWQGVPITVTTGKSLDSKHTEIIVCFGEPNDSDVNQLTFRVDPHEGIDVRVAVKTPGYEQILQSASMNFSYQQTFDEEGHPDAYERVLIDAVRGDHALFSTNEEVLASWRILQPILDAWKRNSDDLRSYAVGSKGPDI